MQDPAGAGPALTPPARPATSPGMPRCRSLAALPWLARAAAPRRALAALGLLALALAPGAPPAAAATPEDWTACRRAIAAVEPESGLPPGLLLAIALVESGRSHPQGGRVEPWPWAYNAAGEGRHPPNRAAARAEVAALLAAGTRSIDVGCMQVNLAYHPQAFAGLDEAFDPAANVRYAARFLAELRARTGDWQQAIANYHSGDALRGLGYHRRVALARIGAGIATGGPIPLPAATMRGLCAPGTAPVLVLGPRRSAAPRAPAAAARPRILCRRQPRS